MVVVLTKTKSHSPTRGCKEFDDVCIHFDKLPECDGQTDGETDRFSITISLAIIYIYIFF